MSNSEYDPVPVVDEEGALWGENTNVSKKQAPLKQINNVALAVVASTFIFLILAFTASQWSQSPPSGRSLEMRPDSQFQQRNALEDEKSCHHGACPTYVYIAAIEGVSHHGFVPIYQNYLVSNNYNLSGSGSGWKRQYGKQAFEILEGVKDDTWILDHVMKMKSSNEVFVQSLSFPACMTDSRKALWKNVDVEKPKESISNLLVLFQQQQHPVSLLKHWGMRENLLGKNYNFKVIWLHRNFRSSVYSHKVWDHGVETHAIIMAAYQLYIASELRTMSKSDPEVCQMIYTDNLEEANAQKHALSVFQSFTPGKGDTENLFGSWRKSSKDPSTLPKDEFEYLIKIENILNDALENIDFCKSKIN